MNRLAPVAHIQAEVALFYRIPRRKMTDHDRHLESSEPRQMAMFLARELTRKNVSEIGRRFNRDRTTILHGIRAVRLRLETDQEVVSDLKALRVLLEDQETWEGGVSEIASEPLPAVELVA